jgi:ATP-binding cassette subfamily C protein
MKPFDSIKKYPVKYALLFLAAAVSTVIQIILPIQMSKLSKDVFNSEIGSLLKCFYIILALAILKFAVDFLFGHLDYWLSNQCGVDYKSEYIYRYLRKEYGKIKDNDFLYLAEKINNDSGICMDYYAEQIPYIVCRVLKTIIIIVILCYNNITLGLLAVLSIAVTFIIYALSKKQRYKLEKRRSEAFFRYASFIGRRMTQVLDIKFGAHYEVVRKSFEEVGYTFVRNAVPVLNFKNGISLLGVTVNTTFLASFFLVAKLKFGSEGSAALTSVIVLTLFYFQQIIEDTSYFLSFGGIRQQYLVSKNRLAELMQVEDDVDGEVIPKEIAEMSVNGIKFGFDDRRLFDNKTLTFDKGKVYGIVGSNGTGKSTMLLLLLGILKPESGNIKWGGIDITKINRSEVLKKNIAVMSQSPIMLGKTIRENIFEDSGKSEIADEKLKKMLEFAMKKDRGLDYEVGSNGKNLSGGECQKVAIVRTFIKDAEVVILDEPTNALDKGSIELLGEILADQKKNRIIIMVTHDEEILKACDVVYKLEKI